MKIKKSTRHNAFCRICLCMVVISTFIFSPTQLNARKITIDLTKPQYGLLPTVGDKTFSSRFTRLLDSLKHIATPEDKVIIKFSKNIYHIYLEDTEKHEVYISNHDQSQPKATGFYINGWNNLTIDGKGATFMFHGTILPFVMINSNNCSLENFSVDFNTPQISQVEIISNNEEKGISFRPSPEVNHKVSDDGRFEVYGEGWSYFPGFGMAFEKETRHIVYRTADIGFNLKQIKYLNDNTYLAPNWKDSRLTPGTIVTMRPYHRPAPAVYIGDNKNTRLENINIHYAEGMGLIAYRCNNVTLKKFNVCLRGAEDSRYFTTHADATHFSQCKGKIISTHGLYENMMDDAINVHGIYLKVMERIDAKTLRLAYGHNQSWGFAWGDVGDSVTFINTKTMENIGEINYISSITPSDKKTELGCREFIAKFKNSLPDEVGTNGNYGIENLTWTPEIYFAHNVIRNNRARGALFSSPKRTVCEYNLFDHTSGSAIVLCGDCNGWYESGAVKDLVIRKNRFVNSLTSLFQFTNAIISIYPVIPEIKNQSRKFHGGTPSAIVISDNVFETFDAPLLYAKSVDGLQFINNKVIKNTDFKPFHFNTHPILFENVINGYAPGFDIKNNDLTE